MRNNVVEQALQSCATATTGRNSSSTPLNVALSLTQSAEEAAATTNWVLFSHCIYFWAHVQAPFTALENARVIHMPSRVAIKHSLAPEAVPSDLLMRFYHLDFPYRFRILGDGWFRSVGIQLLCCHTARETPTTSRLRYDLVRNRETELRTETGTPKGSESPYTKPSFVQNCEQIFYFEEPRWPSSANSTEVRDGK